MLSHPLFVHCAEGDIVERRHGNGLFCLLMFPGASILGYQTD